MTTLSAKQARNTKVFVINSYKNEVEETTLFDHVAESAEKTTSPRGVEHKVFVRQDEEAGTWELCRWEPNGSARVIDTYNTEEEANDEWYTRIYNCDFMPDDQRDTQYWNTPEEAEAELKERIANQ